MRLQEKANNYIHLCGVICAFNGSLARGCPSRKNPPRAGRAAGLLTPFQMGRVLGVPVQPLAAARAHPARASSARQDSIASKSGFPPQQPHMAAHWLLLCAALAFARASRVADPAFITPLDEYVALPDPAYSYTDTVRSAAALVATAEGE